MTTCGSSRPDQRNVTTLNTTVPPPHRDSVVSLFFVNDEVVVVLVGFFSIEVKRKKSFDILQTLLPCLCFVCVCVCVFSVHFLYDHHTEIDNVIGTMYRITESKEIEWAIPRRYRSYASHL